MPKPPVISALRYVREYEAATGTPKQRVLQVAKKLGRTRAQVRATLHDEWSGEKYRATFKRAYVRFAYTKKDVIEALIKTNGDRKAAARLLGFSKQTMSAKMKEFNLAFVEVLVETKTVRLL